MKPKRAMVNVTIFSKSLFTLLVCHTKALDDLDYGTGVIWTIFMIHEHFYMVLFCHFGT